MMKQDAMMDQLQTWGIHSKKEYNLQAFSRNIGLLTPEEQERLFHARVAIPGMGGVGGLHLVTMVRSGVGKFNLSDFDTFEPVNVNRQFGATIPAFGRPKLEVMKEQALLINPFLDINEFQEGIDESNIDLFLEDVDVVLDGLDFFNFDIRRFLFKKAREKGVYVITAGPLGFSSALLVFAPDRGMGFDEYFNIVNGMTREDQYLSFAMGLAPKPTHVKYMDLSRVDLESQKGPSLNVACQICAGMAGTEAIRIILGKKGIKPVPHYFQFDPYAMKLRKGNLVLGNRNPFQKLKIKIVKFILKRNKKINISSPPDFPDLLSVFDSEAVSDDVIQFLLIAGIHAPSGDNAQPWKFSCSENKICLYLDSEADQSFFNINQIASIISCGAVVENIKIAAANFNLATEINYLPGNDTPLMAEMKFSLSDAASKIDKNALLESIWKRKTNRKFYRKTPAPAALLSKIKQSVSAFSGAGVHFVTEKSQLRKLGRMIYKADQIRTRNRSLHEHLNKMIRFTDKEAQETKDGLPLKNLEAGFAGELFIKATKPWNRMNVLNKTGISKIVALHSYRGIVNSSGAALITVDGFDKKSFLKGGQALERAWLTLTKAGFAVQPMTAVTLFWLRWRLNGKEAFEIQNQHLLADVWDEFKGLFQDVSFENQGPVMLLRFGKADDISCRTLRKNIGAFLID